MARKATVHHAPAFNTAAAPPTHSLSNPVSGPCLLKTGILQISAGDYRLFRSGSGQIVVTPIWSLPRRSGFSDLIPTFCVGTRPTGPHPLRARELTTPHPEGLTTRLVPVEVDLKQQIFDVCSSPNNGRSPKGRLRQLCAQEPP